MKIIDHRPSPAASTFEDLPLNGTFTADSSNEVFVKTGFETARSLTNVGTPITYYPSTPVTPVEVEIHIIA